MKNKFIGYGLISILGVNSTSVLAESFNSEKKRQFGVPDSVTENKTIINNQLKLSMSKADIPHQTWQDIEKLTNVWGILKTKILGPDEYIQLIKSQNLSKNNYDKILNSQEFKVISALANSEFLDIANSGDYESLINKLILEGIMEENPEFLLTQKIEELLQTNKHFKQQLQGVMLQNEANNDIIHSETDLDRLIEILKSNQVQPMTCIVAAACAAFVAVGVAIYVAAAVNVAVGLNVAAQISVAVNVAITIGGGGGGGGGGGDCFNNCHSKEDPFIPYSFKIGNIENTMISNLELIKQFAVITAQPALHTKAVIQYKRKEARAVLQAIINIGLIKMPESKQEELFHTLDKLVYKSLEIY